MRNDPNAPKILVAEDDPSVLELVSVRLDLAGYQALPVRDGETAIDVLCNARPQAAIVDLNMPKVDGFAVLKFAQSHRILSKVPIMVLTVRSAVEDVQMAMRLGAKDYVTKPFDDARLIARVGRMLRAAPPPEHDGPDVVVI